MLTGVMNNPQKSLEEEIAFIIEQEFDFIDLTLEPPKGLLDASEIPVYKRMLEDNGKFAVGHTAYYLPIDSPFAPVRIAVQDVLRHQFDIFAAMGIDRVTLHLSYSYPHRFFSYQEKLNLWDDAMGTLSAEASNRKITLMLENTFNGKESFKLLKDLLRKYPTTGFLLDVGHANLNSISNTTLQYLRFFKNRMMHVHLSDNLGRTDDLHLPLGAGGIPWQLVLKLIKGSGYDGTFTLEVFSRQREYVLKSREILESIWQCS